jgi:hypothetical protein
MGALVQAPILLASPDKTDMIKPENMEKIISDIA